MDRNWGKSIDEHYGIDPSWEGEAPMTGGRETTRSGTSSKSR
jgi:hypothetical protein